MVKVQNVCLSCYEAITNPICERCYTKEIVLWLQDSLIDPAVARKIVRKLRSSLPMETKGEPTCIICGKEMTFICTYCYFFKVERLLRSLDISEETLEDFLQTFNYKIYSSVWTPQY